MFFVAHHTKGYRSLEWGVKSSSRKTPTGSGFVGEITCCQDPRSTHLEEVTPEQKSWNGRPGIPGRWIWAPRFGGSMPTQLTLAMEVQPET